MNSSRRYLDEPREPLLGRPSPEEVDHVWGLLDAREVLHRAHTLELKHLQHPAEASAPDSETHDTRFQ